MLLKKLPENNWKLIKHQLNLFKYDLKKTYEYD